MAIYCLLVGVNKYELPNNNLGGCVNDMELMSSVLKEKYLIPSKNILTLSDENATKKKIISGFETHLTQAKEGDIALFYFSGHGSQEDTDVRFLDIEEDGKNEVLMCYDAWASEPFALADKEIRYLIHKITKNGADAVTIIDSCFSGDATRAVDRNKGEAKTIFDRSFISNSPILEDEKFRFIKYTDQSPTRPLNSYYFSDKDDAQSWINDLSKMPEGRHIAISACQNHQLSKEVSFNGERNGVFTYYLCESLNKQYGSTSYRNLVSAVSQRVVLKVDKQLPRIEAIGRIDLNQRFLKSEVEPISFSVVHDNDNWQLNAGDTQGINKNTVLDVKLGDNNLRSTVKSIFLDTSILEINSSNELNIKKQYEAVLIDHGIPRVPVSIEGSDEDTKSLKDALKNSSARFYIKETFNPKYTLECTKDRIKLDRAEPFRPMYIKEIEDEEEDSKENQALIYAEKMAKWEYALSRVCTGAKLPEDLIEFEIRQFSPSKKKYDIIDTSNEEFDLYYQDEPGESIKKEPSYQLSLILNTNYPWNEDVHVSVLYLDPANGLIYPYIMNEVFRQNERDENDGGAMVRKSSRIKYNHSGKDLKAFFNWDSDPKDMPFYTDYFKIFISNFDHDFSYMAQSSIVKDQEFLVRGRGKNKGGNLEDLVNRGGNLEDENIDTLLRASTRTISVHIQNPNITEI